MTITREELERLEREATPAPWRSVPMTVVDAGPEGEPGEGVLEPAVGDDEIAYCPILADGREIGHADAPTDGALIAAARNALPAILGRVRELEAELGEARKQSDENWRALMAAKDEAGNMRVALEHSRANVQDGDELRALRAVAEAAEREILPCRCDYCWTERDRHDPHGCTWADLADTRAALDAWRGLR